MTSTMDFSPPAGVSGPWQRDEKQRDIRRQNICAARAVGDAIRTSLGPFGMDKMIKEADGNVLISNDGATILERIAVMHPVAKMMVELSRAQDVEAGDGTTTVVVLCGALLDAAQHLLDKGMHPHTIAGGFVKAALQVEGILRSVSIDVQVDDATQMQKLASTSLMSKIVSQNAQLLSGIATEAIQQVIKPVSGVPTVDLKDVRIVKCVGGTVEDCELVKGLVMTSQSISKRANGPTRMANAKIGLIQFCLTSPKTDMDNAIVIEEYQQMDRLLKQERLIIAQMIKQIQKTGCNCLLIQKSILRESANDLALDYLAKAKIMVIRDIGREDIESISKNLGCTPVASLDHFTCDKLGNAQLVEDQMLDDGSHIIKMTGLSCTSAISVLLRASNSLMLDETERSLHDALCVLRCLIKKPHMVMGGGAPEVQLACRLTDFAKTLPGSSQICVKKYAEALEIIPYTLAENAGLCPLSVVSSLRVAHQKGVCRVGVNTSGEIAEVACQPLLVTLSAVQLATETVVNILKIDDIVLCR